MSTDDDAIVDRDWVRQHVVEYRDENVGAVGGMEHVRNNDLFAAYICSSYLDEFRFFAQFFNAVCANIAHAGSQSA